MALRFGNSGVRFGAGRPARLGGTPPARAGLGKLLLGVPGTFLCGFPNGGIGLKTIANWGRVV